MPAFSRPVFPLESDPAVRCGLPDLLRAEIPIPGFIQEAFHREYEIIRNRSASPDRGKACMLMEANELNGSCVFSADGIGTGVFPEKCTIGTRRPGKAVG